MPNALTGDNEAVLQISVRQINGLLATMHQTKIDPAASPTFPHSTNVQVGEPGPLAAAGVEAARFGKWITAAASEVEPASGAPGGLQTRFVQMAAPGVSTMFETAFRNLADAHVAIVGSGQVRGIAQVQCSAPAISVAPGAVSEVTVHVYVRAHYTPDKGSAPLGQPIHGEVQAVYRVRPKTLPDGRLVLSVDVSPLAHQVQFLPEPPSPTEPGLTAADAAEIAQVVRQALQDQFQATDVDLPPDFPFTEFAALGSGPAQAMVIPLKLSGPPFPAGLVHSATVHFIGASDFAIGVSKEHAQTFFDAAVASMHEYAESVQVTASAFGVTATYTAAVAGVSFTWKAGAIDVAGAIDLIGPVDGQVTFKQTIALELHVPSQTVSIKAVGEPEVDEPVWVPHDRAVGIITNGRAQALDAAAKPLNTVLAAAKARLTAGLNAFDTSASAQYTALEVTPDALIVRGAIGTMGRLAPIVHSVETADQLAHTAFGSWIPGGRIERYTWSWVEQIHPIPWANETKTSEAWHRFIVPKPPGMAFANRVCLLIEGRRTTANGAIESVTTGETCTVTAHEPILVQPPWWMKVMVPVWLPDYPDLALEDQIAAHVNVAGDPIAGRRGTNTLVHFTGPRMDRPLEGLSRALESAAGTDALLVVLVLPAGAFAVRRGELEGRLGGMNERFGRHLLITEDYLGGWTRAFAAGEGPSTHLINARGEFAWAELGPLDARSVAAALTQHALPGDAPRNSPLRLSVQAGDRAPDALLRDDQGNRIALHRLRGHRVLLNFWQAWSAPCRHELAWLDRLRTERGTIVLAINGGEDPAVLTETRRQAAIGFPLVADPDQAIAALYGVRCWPTTVSINEEGVVDRIQFGRSHEQPRRPVAAREAH